MTAVPLPVSVRLPAFCSSVRATELCVQLYSTVKELSAPVKVAPSTTFFTEKRPVSRVYVLVKVAVTVGALTLPIVTDWVSWPAGSRV